MKYLSICSGIEAASVAWHPLGWEPLAFSEIEPFPRAVLAHHYPDVPLHGDFTVLRHEPWIVDADVLVGGTPCQAFSVAGLRNSLDDARGNLSLEFIKLADSIDAAREASGRDPSIIVWENVPGVLSVKDNAFGCFLASLAGEAAPLVPPRGKWTDAGVVIGPQRTIAWRILDAQYFGLAQRRRRVFVVASAREGFDPAAVLLECEGVRRDTPPRREAREIAPTIPARSTAGGGLGTDFDLDGGVIRATSTGDISHCLNAGRQWPVDIAPTLNASFGEKQGLEDQHIRGGQDCSFPAISQCLNAGGMGRRDWETETFIPTIGCVFDDVAHTLKAEGFDASEDGTGRGTPLVPVIGAICKDSFSGGAGGRPEGAAAGHFLPVAYRTTGNDGVFETGEIVHALTTNTDPNSHVIAFSAKDHGADATEELSPTLRAMPHHNSHANGGGQMAVAITGVKVPSDGLPMHTCHLNSSAYAFQPRIARNGRGDMGEVVNALNAQSGETGKGDAAPCVATAMQARRLTVVECSRLQGFPDDYLLSVTWRGKCPPPDGPMYKALGNSMAVPVMAWIGRRIAEALK